MEIPRETIQALTALHLPGNKLSAVLTIIGDMLASSSPSKGKAIPEDWSCDGGELISYGLALGFTIDEIEHHAADMKLWAQANRNRAVARKADWDLTFKGWLRRAAKNIKSKQATGRRTAFLDIAADLGDGDYGHRPCESEPQLALGGPVLQSRPR